MKGKNDFVNGAFKGEKGRNNVSRLGKQMKEGRFRALWTWEKGDRKRGVKYLEIKTR